MQQQGDMRSTGPRKDSAVSAAFVANFDFLKRFLARFFSDRQDIEDVAQEAYLRAYVAEQKKEIEQPKAFLFRIARNLALTQLTRKSRQITDYIEDSADSIVIEGGATVDSEVEAQQSFGLYCEAVAALPEKCRQVFLLRKVHGLPHKEIAERMSMSVSSVEKYLRRGLLETRAYVREREGLAPAVDAATGVKAPATRVFDE
jgi:RNA polymerase sigma-70 factor (ECF subfamily)